MADSTSTPLTAKFCKKKQKTRKYRNDQNFSKNSKAVLNQTNKIAVSSGLDSLFSSALEIPKQLLWISN